MNLMKKWIPLVLIPLLASLPSLALAGKLVPEPVLPRTVVELRTQYMPCPDSGMVWRTFYDVSGDGQLAEIVTYGRGGSDKPLVWVYFHPDVEGGFSHAILTLPDKPAETISGTDLQELSICSLPSYL